MYSEGLKTELGKPNAIPIPNVLKFGFRMVQTIRKPNIQNGSSSLGCFSSSSIFSIILSIGIQFFFQFRLPPGFDLQTSWAASQSADRYAMPLPLVYKNYIYKTT